MRVTFSMPPGDVVSMFLSGGLVDVRSTTLSRSPRRLESVSSRHCSTHKNNFHTNDLAGEMIANCSTKLNTYRSNGGVYTCLKMKGGVQLGNKIGLARSTSCISIFGIPGK
jgi:hypothetical protein